MDKDTLRAKNWLDRRFAEGVKDGEYFAHQPIYGYNRGRTEGRGLIRYATDLSILTKIAQFKFDNFIDIGGAEGFMANLVKRAFNVDSYTCDLSFEANLRAKELFGLNTVGIDLSNLPFGNEAFDVVLCSEVLEHTVNPLQAIYELKRITRKVLIITTEAVCYSELERKMRMSLVDLNWPHGDRNWFMADDFIRILGKDIQYENTIPDVGLFTGKNYSFDEAKDILKGYRGDEKYSFGGCGILVTYTKGESGKDRVPVDIPKLVDLIFCNTVDLKYKMRTERAVLDEKMTGILRCPKCLSQIKNNNNVLACMSCGKKYAVNHGIPLMYTSGDDSAYLEEKWDRIYDGKYGIDHNDIKKFEEIYKHTTTEPGTLWKYAAKRLLKFNKYIRTCKKVVDEKSIGGLLLYLADRFRKKINKEIKRILKRLNIPRQNRK